MQRRRVMKPTYLPWLYLLIAGVLEVRWVVGLK
jgi:hypothetical protein